jgi:hypothetical protein
MQTCDKVCAVAVLLLQLATRFAQLRYCCCNLQQGFRSCGIVAATCSKVSAVAVSLSQPCNKVSALAVLSLQFATRFPQLRYCCRNLATRFPHLRFCRCNLQQGFRTCGIVAASCSKVSALAVLSLQFAARNKKSFKPCRNLQQGIKKVLNLVARRHKKNLTDFDRL